MPPAVASMERHTWMGRRQDQRQHAEAEEEAVLHWSHWIGVWGMALAWPHTALAWESRVQAKGCHLQFEPKVSRADQSAPLVSGVLELELELELELLLAVLECAQKQAQARAQGLLAAVQVLLVLAVAAWWVAVAPLLAPASAQAWVQAESEVLLARLSASRSRMVLRPQHLHLEHLTQTLQARRRHSCTVAWHCSTSALAGCSRHRHCWCPGTAR